MAPLAGHSSSSPDEPDEPISEHQPSDSPATSTSNSGSPGAHQAPALGTLLRLRPGECELQFWSDSATRDALRCRDRWATVILLAFHCVHFFALQRLMLWNAPAAAQYTLIIVCNLGHLAWLFLAPSSYDRLRQHIVLVHRLARVTLVLPVTKAAMTLFLPLTLVASWQQHEAGPLGPAHPAPTPSGLEAAPPHHPATHAASRQLLPPWLDALRIALVLSGSYTTLVYAAALPLLPFALQCCVQLLTLWLLVALGFPHMLSALHLHTRHASAVAACQGMNFLLEFASMGLVGTTPGSSSLDRPCQQSPHAALLLFMQLLMAFMVPVYIAYHTEKRLKVAFLRQAAALAQGSTNGHTPTESSVTDAGTAHPFDAEPSGGDLISEGGSEWTDEAGEVWQPGAFGQAAAGIFVRVLHVSLMGLQAWVLALKLAPLFERQADS